MSENEGIPSGGPAEQAAIDEVQVLSQLVNAMRPLDKEARIRLFRTLATFYDIPLSDRQSKGHIASSQSESTALAAPTQPSELSPKQFLFEKKPITDVERVACLAYFLSHHRGTKFFKTLDISKLNTEAAQVKFSNPAQAVDNATKAGLLVPAEKGQKQVSAIGEQYVEMLPDRTAAREAVEHARRRRNRAKGRGGSGERSTSDES
jgi:hypothetical protein